MIYILLTNPESKERTYRSFEELWKYFLSVRSLVSFNDRAIPLMWCLLGFIGICFLWAVVREKIIGRNFVSQRDGFLLLFCVLTLLYFKLPWAYGPPAWINDRTHLFLFPILLAWFALSYPKWMKYGLAVVMICFSLAHLGLTIHDYHLLNKDMKEFTSGAHLITPNSAVSITTIDWYGAENHGEIKYMSPFFHDTCYYCLGNGSLYTGNYEPKYSYFPLRYREGYWKFEYIGVIDYVLVWRMDENSDDVVKLKKEYDLIHKTRNLMMFRHKGGDDNV